MEPADLNRPSPDDAQLDAWLRANASDAPLPDDGFSQRVLASLPPRIDRAGAARRIALCLIGALTGAIAPWLTDFGLPNPAASAVDFSSAARQVLQPLADPNLAPALALTGLCLLYVFRPHRLLHRL